MFLNVYLSTCRLPTEKSFETMSLVTALQISLLICIKFSRAQIFARLSVYTSHSFRIGAAAVNSKAGEMVVLSFWMLHQVRRSCHSAIQMALPRIQGKLQRLVVVVFVTFHIVTVHGVTCDISQCLCSYWRNPSLFAMCNVLVSKLSKHRSSFA